MAQAPEIKSWSKVQLLESDIDERLEVWEIEGQDRNGVEYTAIGEYYEDEPVVVKEIQVKDNG